MTRVVQTFPCTLCRTAVRRAPRRGVGAPRGALQITCPRCRYRIYDYPRICVGFAVVKQDSLLLLIRGEAPRLGAIDMPGGFLEAGEAFEPAARRELLEETGLKVGPAQLLGSYWDEYDLPGFGPFPTLNYYYFAHWRRGSPRAADDAAEAHWVPLAGLGRRALQQRFAWSHMRRVMRDVRRRVYDSGN